MLPIGMTLSSRGLLAVPVPKPFALPSGSHLWVLPSRTPAVGGSRHYAGRCCSSRAARPRTHKDRDWVDSRLPLLAIGRDRPATEGAISAAKTVPRPPH